MPVKNWFTDVDPDIYEPTPSASYQENIESFRQAYIIQSKLRQDAEAGLTRMIANRMDAQDRALIPSPGMSSIIEFSDGSDEEQT